MNPYRLLQHRVQLIHKLPRRDLLKEMVPTVLDTYLGKLKREVDPGVSEVLGSKTSAFREIGCRS